MNQKIRLLNKFALLISILGLFVFFSDFGFYQNSHSQNLLNNFYFFVLGVGIISTCARYFLKYKKIKRKVFVFDVLSVGFTLWIYYMYFYLGEGFETDLFLNNSVLLKIAVLFSFIREVSEVKLSYNSDFLNPAQLFLLSFFVIVMVGTFLLMLPKATHQGHGLSFLDALFTSTSAVCVTGLVVVDTATYFTEFGQAIILFLIQIGGIGILTFASYFSYFFTGGSSYENQMTMSDINNSSKIGDVFKTLKQIIIITFSIELLSALFIYSSLDASPFKTHHDQIFFSLFHSVSAFCNAGFSTFTKGLHEDSFRTNYYLQIVIILTFVLGGLGFSIVSNITNYIKYRIEKILNFGSKKIIYKPWVLTLNSRITLVTTFSITAVAFVVFYLLEYNNTLSEHSSFGKIVTALFGATTPRTAGFNTIDVTEMLLPTTMIVFLLMWIGASPASTGGGIKTSTFAIAVLNVISLARGKTRIETFRREISNTSIRRSYAVIFLSFFVIGLGIMLISIFDKDKNLLDIAFECFSAYSTVGLSLGITASLSDLSKMVIIAIMFVGRVGVLTLVIGVFRKVKFTNYRYPAEDVTIN